MKELIAYAKARPGQINFSSAGIGSGTQINGEMFRPPPGFEATHVPYKGAVDSLNDAMTGRVQFTFSPVLVSAGQVKAGKALALAVSTAQALAAVSRRADRGRGRIPGVRIRPVVRAARVGEDAAAAGECRQREIVRILNLPDIKERMLTQGATPTPPRPGGVRRLHPLAR